MASRFFALRNPAPLAMLAALALLAATPAPVSAEAAYVLRSQIDLPKLLPPPPAEGSAAQQRDLKAVLDAQAARTEAQIERAKVTAELSVFAFTDVLGTEFDAARLPKTAALFKRIYGDAIDVMQAGKNLWKRPRPFLASSDVHPIGDKPKSGSYPSGNALLGHLYAIVLADMLPEKSAELFARGDETGDNRVISGVHFPTDLIAGRRTAVAIAVALFANPTYQADFAAAKSELRTALKL
jgi:acid phosphatase (class A)